MRILLAARHPPGGRLPIGGVQSWCATVGAELQRLGHEVHFWGPGQSAHGIFDLGIVANYQDTRPVLRLCKRHLSVCHGIVPPEKPPVQSVAFTSEEVRDFWQGLGPIIRQPIDLDFWRPGRAQRNRLVRFSYRAGLPFVPAIAEALGLEYTHLAEASPEQCRTALQEAACVLATGRAALEAMACGAPVVICDDRPYQGPLMDLDTLGAMRRNYSGRDGVIPDQASVTAAIEAAMAIGGLRFHVAQHHDAATITDALLCCTS